VPQKSCANRPSHFGALSLALALACSRSLSHASTSLHPCLPSSFPRPASPPRRVLQPRSSSSTVSSQSTAAAPMSGCTSSARSSRMRCARARTRRHTRDARTSQQERDERADGGREREREPRVFISRIGGGSSGSSFACAQSAMAVHHVAASFSPCPHPFPSLSPLSLSLSPLSLCAPPSVCARVTDLAMLFALSSPYPSHPPSSSW
jgi:hypothetical protein